jgi:hypothetical protein
LKTLPESFGCLEQLEHLDMFENPCLWGASWKVWKCEGL